MNEEHSEVEISITEEQVESYLAENPDFLRERLELFTDLNIKHDAGNAVSLIERQVAVLRQRNNDLHKKLNTLIETARENDHLFDLTQRLVLALLECTEFGDIVDALYYSFDKEFGIEHTRLNLFNDALPPSNAHILKLEDGQNAVAQHLQYGQAVCGGLDKPTIDFLFTDKADQIASAAIAPLTSGSQLLGILAIGNSDPNYYKSSTGSLFLGHISEVLSRIIRPYY